MLHYMYVDVGTVLWEHTGCWYCIVGTYRLLVLYCGNIQAVGRDAITHYSLMDCTLPFNSITLIDLILSRLQLLKSLEFLGWSQR